MLAPNRPSSISIHLGHKNNKQFLFINKRSSDVLVVGYSHNLQTPPNSSNHLESLIRLSVQACVSKACAEVTVFAWFYNILYNVGM